MNNLDFIEKYGDPEQFAEFLDQNPDAAIDLLQIINTYPQCEGVRNRMVEYAEGDDR